MEIISVNVGLPQEVLWKNRTVETGIFKEPVEDRVRVRTLNLEGDGQADLSVHGGPTKAVYVYPSENYEYWQGQFPETEHSWGMFGENLTTSGLSEESVRIGDGFRIGSAEFVVTEPRMPCYKLALRFGSDQMIKLFLDSERSGFYLKVTTEGELGRGDSIEATHRLADSIAVADVARLYGSQRGNLDLLRKAVAVEALPGNWKRHSQRQIDKINPRSVHRSPFGP